MVTKRICLWSNASACLVLLNAKVLIPSGKKERMENKSIQIFANCRVKVSTVA